MILEKRMQGGHAIEMIFSYEKHLNKDIHLFKPISYYLMKKPTENDNGEMNTFCQIYP